MNSSFNLCNESDLSRYDLGIPQYYIDQNGEATIYFEPSLLLNPIDPLTYQPIPCAETEHQLVEPYYITITNRLEEQEG